MGKFACHCGYVISDSSTCPFLGSLRWSPEDDYLSDKSIENVRDFLQAITDGKKDEWIKNYFGDIYPTDMETAEIIDDIYMNVSNEKGHMVYQCPECERIYLQKEYYTDEWICYEKSKVTS